MTICPRGISHAIPPTYQKAIKHSKAFIKPLFISLLLLSILSSCFQTIHDGNVQASEQITYTEPLIITTNYTLESDLFFTNSHGFLIRADNITIDGAGYKITGNKTSDRCSWITRDDPAEQTATHGILNNGYDNIKIKNLEIEQFATGIYLHGEGNDKVLGNIIDECIIHDNGLSTIETSSSESITHGIHAIFTRELTIKNCEIYNNQGTGGDCDAGGNGIYIRGGGADSDADNNHIIGNIIHDNAKAGFWTNYLMDQSELRNNNVYENGDGEGITDPQRGGIILRCVKSNDNIISKNNIHNNYGDGLFIGGDDNTIQNNIIVNNSQNGANLGRSDGTKNNILTQNTFCSNQEYDVYNVHANQQAGNTGNSNTGTTAYQYTDEDAQTNTNFSVLCTSPDEQAPETYIQQKPPKKTDNTTVTFEWYATDDSSQQSQITYSYILNGYQEEWSSWTTKTTITYNELEEKNYTFKVTSKDTEGNTDPTPATYSFQIQFDEGDYIPPSVTLQTTPPKKGESSSIRFTWIGIDDTTTTHRIQYRYKLTGYDTTWNPWTTDTEKEYNALSEGDYVFYLTCRDEAGNVQSTPLSYSFTITPHEEGNLYLVNWTEHTKTINEKIFVEKENITSYPLIITQSYPIEVSITVTWEDDVFLSFFNWYVFGEDEISFNITDSNGGHLRTFHSKGSGQHAFHLSSHPQQYSFEFACSNIGDVDAIGSSTHPDILNISQLDLDIHVQIGERGILRKNKDEGNTISLHISYTYLQPTVSLLEDRTPPKTTIDTIESTANAEKLQITWSGSDDIDKDNIIYHYKLLGYDSTWKKTTQNMIQYPTLNEGTYFFTIYAEDQSGNKEQEPTNTTITIIAPTTNYSSSENTEALSNETKNETLASKKTNTYLQTPSLNTFEIMGIFSFTFFCIFISKRRI